MWMLRSRKVRLSEASLDLPSNFPMLTCKCLTTCLEVLLIVLFWFWFWFMIFGPDFCNKKPLSFDPRKITQPKASVKVSPSSPWWGKLPIFLFGILAFLYVFSSIHLTLFIVSLMPRKLRQAQQMQIQGFKETVLMKFYLWSFSGFGSGAWFFGPDFCNKKP